jgi:hypothetical protein
MDNINIMGQLSGISDVESSLSIYPNPNKGAFTVSHSLNNPRLILYSAEGRVIMDEIISSKKELIQLDVQSGVYLLYISDGSISYVEKITIK